MSSSEWLNDFPKDPQSTMTESFHQYILLTYKFIQILHEHI